jgi:hypothetical protein
VKWCIEWYYHPEAVTRVEALWRAWEPLRLDGATGISVWFKDHADHHMSVLLDSRGPFYKCDMQKHRDPENTWNRRKPRRAGSQTFRRRKHRGTNSQKGETANSLPYSVSKTWPEGLLYGTAAILGRPGTAPRFLRNGIVRTNRSLPNRPPKPLSP